MKSSRSLAGPGLWSWWAVSGSGSIFSGFLNFEGFDRHTRDGRARHTNKSRKPKKLGGFLENSITRMPEESGGNYFFLDFLTEMFAS